MSRSQLSVLDGLSLKIRSFLASAGVEPDESVKTPVDLIRFFEREFDTEVLGFLEEEWVGEQIERDTVLGPLSNLRESAAEEPGREDD